MVKTLTRGIYRDYKGSSFQDYYVVFAFKSVYHGLVGGVQLFLGCLGKSLLQNVPQSTLCSTLGPGHLLCKGLFLRNLFFSTCLKGNKQVPNTLDPNMSSFEKEP